MRARSARARVMVRVMMRVMMRVMHGQAEQAEQHSGGAAPPQRTKPALMRGGALSLSRVGSRLPRLSVPRRCSMASSAASSPPASAGAPMASLEASWASQPPLPPASAPMASALPPPIPSPPLPSAISSPAIPRSWLGFGLGFGFGFGSRFGFGFGFGSGFGSGCAQHLTPRLVHGAYLLEQLGRLLLLHVQWVVVVSTRLLAYRLERFQPQCWLYTRGGAAAREAKQA